MAITFSPRAGERDYYARMRACATFNAVVLGVALAALSFSACSSGQTPPPASSGASTSAPTESSASPAADTSAAPAPQATPSGSAAAGPPKRDITNEPSGGVVMNNAATAGDAGATDRVQAITDVLKANRDKFRACFDVYSKSHKGQNGSVYLVLKLKPDGAVLEASTNATKSTLHDGELEACMLGEARKLAYPKSPVGKETTFTYPFDFKAK